MSALHVFNFAVEFEQMNPAQPDKAAVPLCEGRFSEVSGLEATMEPKAIREGGRNYGEIQRVGLVKYSTVILKRGVTRAPDLFTWFDLVAKGASAVRLRAKLKQLDYGGAEILRYTMDNALPIKFRAATFAAAGTDVGVEELHFVHERMTLTMTGG